MKKKRGCCHATLAAYVSRRCAQRPPGALSYRVHGSIDGLPFDVTFTCISTGRNMAAMEESTERVRISDSATRVSRKGSFGCMQARDAVEFPDAVPAMDETGRSAGRAKSMSVAASLFTGSCE